MSTHGRCPPHSVIVQTAGHQRDIKERRERRKHTRYTGGIVPRCPKLQAASPFRRESSHLGGRALETQPPVRHLARCETVPLHPTETSIYVGSDRDVDLVLFALWKVLSVLGLDGNSSTSPTVHVHGPFAMPSQDDVCLLLSLHPPLILGAQWKERGEAC